MSDAIETQEWGNPIETCPKDEDVLLFDGEKKFVGSMSLKVWTRYTPPVKTSSRYVWEYWPAPIRWMPVP